MASNGDSLYTVRTPDGLELGPVRPETIVDLILSKKVFGNETVSRDGRNWLPIRDVPIFQKALEQRDSGVTSINEIDLEDDDESGQQEEILNIEVDDTLRLEDSQSAKPITPRTTAHKPTAAERIELDAIEDALEGTIPPPPPSTTKTQPEPLELEPAEVIAVDEPIEATEIIEDAEEVEEVEPLELEEAEETLGQSPATLEAELEELEPIKPAAKAPKPSAESVLELEILSPAETGSDVAAVLEELRNPENRYTIRDPDGLVLGPIRVATLRDLIDAGKITNADYIQKNNQNWAAITTFPELVYLMKQHRSA